MNEYIVLCINVNKKYISILCVSYYACAMGSSLKIDGQDIWPKNVGALYGKYKTLCIVGGKFVCIELLHIRCTSYIFNCTGFSALPGTCSGNKMCHCAIILSVLRGCQMRLLIPCLLCELSVCFKLSIETLHFSGAYIKQAYSVCNI
jgi:hypothetical protein